MARAGLTGFLKTISTELAPFGITVNALLPGTHKTSRIDQLVKDTAARENKPEEEVLREMMDAIPCKTIGDPVDFGLRLHSWPVPGPVISPDRIC
jgi:3-oxoacyl-[acyl-carrier protein] reductase